MLKEADHLDKVKRLRVSEKDLASHLPHYGVRSPVLVPLNVVDLFVIRLPSIN
jgi:ATP-dependent RNA helicase DDX51/DBP6